jgi:hypothetical protein
MRVLFAYITACRGAAWTAAYACHILGLPACALGLRSDLVPITSTYEDARVIIDLGVSYFRCELFCKGDLLEVVSLECGAKAIDRGWSIDCTEVDFVNLHHPNLRQYFRFQRISNFAAIEAMNAVGRLSSSFETFA